MSRLDEIRELAGWDADVAWLLARIDQTLALCDTLKDDPECGGFAENVLRALTGEDPE